MQYRFLIYFSYSYAIPIGKPLEQEILRLGYQVKWFADEDEGKRSFVGFPNKIVSIQDVVDYAPHILLAITDSCPDFLNCLKVQIFHGFPANKRKGTDQFKIRGLFDLYCTQGPSSTIPFKERQKKFKNFKVIETGWSKVDPLFPIENFQNSRPTVLVTSTFTQEYSIALKEEVITELLRLSRTGEWKILVVLHPKLDKSVHDNFRELQNENFVFHETTDLIPLFKQADFMFADTTSAITEFLLQEKPVVTFNNNMPGDYLINILEVSNIESAFNEAMNPPKALLKKIKKFSDFSHPYRDGKSSSRVIQATINQLHDPKKNLKKKPLNLIRKWKIRQTLDYFTLKSFNKPYHIPDWSKREKLTAILPVGNEVHNIDEVIESVSFADEILVVDSMSTDGTYEHALKKDVRVIRRDYEYSASQKNFAIPQATHEWILLVDADERVTNKLRDEILNKLHNGTKGDHVAFWIGRANHFMNQRVHFSGMRNDKVIRLFMRDKCRYEDKMVHAEIIADGKVGHLKHKFYHNTYRGINEFIKKLNRYATWQAVDYDKTTGMLTPYHFVIKPLYGFFKHYIVQLGFVF